jgi:hypothetical protein
VPGNFVEGYEIQWRRVMGGTYGYLNGWLKVCSGVVRGVRTAPWWPVELKRGDTTAPGDTDPSDSTVLSSLSNNTVPHGSSPSSSSHSTASHVRTRDELISNTGRCQVKSWQTLEPGRK